MADIVIRQCNSQVGLADHLVQVDIMVIARKMLLLVLLLVWLVWMMLVVRVVIITVVRDIAIVETWVRIRWPWRERNWSSAPDTTSTGVSRAVVEVVWLEAVSSVLECGVDIMCCYPAMIHSIWLSSWRWCVSVVSWEDIRHDISLADVRRWIVGSRYLRVKAPKRAVNRAEVTLCLTEELSADFFHQAPELGPESVINNNSSAAVEP